MLGRSWLRATLIAIGLLGSVLVLGAGSVLAHAEPETTVPPINGSVETAPPMLEITFSEEVTSATTIEVLGPDGKAVNAAPAELDLNDPERRHVTVMLFGNLPAGAYTVNWASVSAEDGDSDSGSYTFTVTVGGSGAATASPAASPSASPVASPVAMTGKEQLNAVAEAAQLAATQRAQTEDNVDEGDLGLAVLAGIGAAIVIYIFWRVVRPKPGERIT